MIICPLFPTSKPPCRHVGHRSRCLDSWIPGEWARAWGRPTMVVSFRRLSGFRNHQKTSTKAYRFQGTFGSRKIRVMIYVSNSNISYQHDLWVYHGVSLSIVTCSYKHTWHTPKELLFKHLNFLYERSLRNHQPLLSSPWCFFS